MLLLAATAFYGRTAFSVLWASVIDFRKKWLSLTKAMQSLLAECFYTVFVTKVFLQQPDAHADVL